MFNGLAAIGGAIDAILSDPTTTIRLKSPGRRYCMSGMLLQRCDHGEPHGTGGRHLRYDRKGNPIRSPMVTFKDYTYVNMGKTYDRSGKR